MNSKRRLTIYLDPDLLMKIKVYAAIKDANVSEYATLLLRDGIKVQAEEDKKIGELEQKWDSIKKQMKLEERL